MDGEFYLLCHSCLHCFKDSHCHGVLRVQDIYTSKERMKKQLYEVAYHCCAERYNDDLIVIILSLGETKRDN